MCTFSSATAPPARWLAQGLGRTMRTFVVTAALLAMLVAPFSLSGCAGRPFGRSLDDASAGMALRSRMLRSDFNFARANVEVTDGLVLLTGVVDSPLARIEAERLAWSAPKVRNVANELVTEPNAPERLPLGAGDQLISTTVRARLVASWSVAARRIHIESYDGVVYLLGRTRTRAAAERAAEIAASVRGVERVVSYIHADEADD